MQEEKKRGGGVGRKEWVKEERRGLCAEGPDPRLSHPEDLCSLAGWFQRRHTEGETRGREKKEGAGGIATEEDWA